MPVPGLRKRYRETHHYSSHTGMFTQGCGLTEKTFQPWQLSFFKAEARQRPCDITPIESRVDFYKVWLRCQISLKLLFHQARFNQKVKTRREKVDMVVIWWKKLKGPSLFTKQLTTCHGLPPHPPSAVCAGHNPIDCCLTSPRLG